MRSWDLSPAQLIYIGDNPDKDFFAPRALGWETARVRLNGQLRSDSEARSPEFSPAHEFGTFADLAAWLRMECRLMPAQEEASTR